MSPAIAGSQYFTHTAARRIEGSRTLATVHGKAVVWCLPAFVQAIIPNDVGHPQSIIGKDLGAAFDLR
jgi:hypothetical protein